jgi:hypothetical protein
VSFESAVKEETKERIIVIVLFEDMKGDGLEDSAVVLSVHGLVDARFELLSIWRACFLVEYRGIEVFFGGKVAEYDGLVHAGRECDFFCGGSAKSLLGEEADGNVQYLVATFLGVHARGGFFL